MSHRLLGKNLTPATRIVEIIHFAIADLEELLFICYTGSKKTEIVLLFTRRATRSGKIAETCMVKKLSIRFAHTPWQGVVFALVCGLLIGALTVGGQGILPGSWGQLANSGAIWVIPAFFLGALLPTDKSAALAGIAMLVGEVCGFYATQAVVGIALSLSYILYWLVIALIAGPVFGVAGRWWHTTRLPREKHVSRGVIALALFSGVFVAEGLYMLLIVQYPVEGWAGIIIGGVLALVLGHSMRERIFALLFLPLATLFFAAGYWFFNWVASQFVGHLHF